jgi:molybdopterin-biosynthesis enzyme MoeA-like protein
MAEVPEGSEIEFQEQMRFPIVSFRNIYIFPGIPEYLENKFAVLREKFRTSVFYLKRIYLNCHESSIAAVLTNVDGKYRDVSIGSYPVLGQPDFRVIVTAETKFEGSLNKAVDELIHALPENVLVRVE